MQNIKIQGTTGEQITLECNGVKIAALITTDGLFVDPLDGTRRLIKANANGVAVAASKFLHRETNEAGVSQILAPIRDALFKTLTSDAAKATTTEAEKTTTEKGASK